MTENEIDCPECPEPVDRRDFLRVVGTGAAALAAGTAIVPTLSASPHRIPLPRRGPRPAEALCRELFANLTEEQRRQVLLPWNSPLRLRTYNSPMNVRISTAYTAPQQELLQRIMRAISSGDDGYTKLSRNGGWDTGGGFGGCGANFFGSLADGQQWAFVFSGHHLTVRCDNDSEPNAAFGGPMYYGHGAEGHSQRNVFNFQTRAVQSVHDALTAQQRPRAIMNASGGSSTTFRANGFPGIASADLTADQRTLVGNVMRECLAPYRREDADEVMDIVRRNGGMDRLHLGFFGGTPGMSNWSYWRLEGPGFVWNYRVLPHVHCYVNIAVRA